MIVIRGLCNVLLRCINLIASYFLIFSLTQEELLLCIQQTLSRLTLT